MSKTLTESIYELANQIVENNFKYSNVPQDEITSYRDGLIKGMEEMYETISIANEDYIKDRLKMALLNMKEELYKWYPIVDEGEYWTDYDIAGDKEGKEKIGTIVSDGNVIYSYEECNFGWGTMAKMGWKYMRIKID